MMVRIDRIKQLSVGEHVEESLHPNKFLEIVNDPK